MTLFDNLEQRRVEQDRHRENTARLASAFAKFNTTGCGSFEFPVRVDFELTFIDEPFVAYGSSVDTQHLSAIQDGVDEPHIPLSTGYVTDWDLDDREFYVGCWCAVRVNFPTTDGLPADIQPELKHFFTFTAIGIKDIPSRVQR